MHVFFWCQCDCLIIGALLIQNYQCLLVQHYRLSQPWKILLTLLFLWLKIVDFYSLIFIRCHQLFYIIDEGLFHFWCDIFIFWMWIYGLLEKIWNWAIFFIRYFKFLVFMILFFLKNDRFKLRVIRWLFLYLFNFIKKIMNEKLLNQLWLIIFLWRYNFLYN